MFKKIAETGSMLLFIACATSMMVSGKIMIVYQEPNLCAALRHGCLGIWLDEAGAFGGWGVVVLRQWHYDLTSINIPYLSDRLLGCTIPMWVPSIVFLFSWRFLRKRRLIIAKTVRAVCNKCQYSLIGLNKKSPCPECGHISNVSLHK